VLRIERIPVVVMMPFLFEQFHWLQISPSNNLLLVSTYQFLCPSASSRKAPWVILTSTLCWLFAGIDAGAYASADTSSFTHTRFSVEALAILP
jgi:hypothetical protein